MKMIRWILAPLCCLLSLVCCGSSNDGSPDDGRRPALNLEIASWNGTYATFEVQTLNASHVRALCLPATVASVVVTAAEVYEQGTRYTGTRFTVEGLEPMTAYVLYAVACGEAGAYGSVQQVAFTTEYADPVPYAWESAKSAAKRA